MISRHTINGFFWTNLISPTPEEIKSVAEEYNLNHSITSDLYSPTPKPRFYESGKFIYTIFHIPTFQGKKGGDTEEVDFIIGRNMLITTRYGHVDAMHQFEKQMEVKEIFGKNKTESTHIFFHIMQEIQKNLFDELAFMDDSITSIENKIFEGLEKEMVLTISEAGRSLLNFRKTLEPHKEIFEFLKDKGEEHFGPSFSQNMASLFQNWRRLDELSRNHTAMLGELRETNNSLLSTKENEVMKTLTIMAFVTFPLSLIASIFGMNTSWLPIVGGKHDFWLVIGIMGCTALVMFTFFKRKKWL